MSDAIATHLHEAVDLRLDALHSGGLCLALLQERLLLLDELPSFLIESTQSLS